MSDNNSPIHLCRDCFHGSSLASCGGWNGPFDTCAFCGKRAWVGLFVSRDQLLAGNASEAHLPAQEEASIAKFVQAAADVVALGVSQQEKVKDPSEASTVTTVTVEQLLLYCKEFDHVYGSHLDPLFAGKEVAEYIQYRVAGGRLDPLPIDLGIDLYSKEYAHERGWD